MKIIGLCTQANKDSLRDALSGPMNDTLGNLLEKNEVLYYVLKKNIEGIMQRFILEAYVPLWESVEMTEDVYRDLELIRSIRKVETVWFGTYKSWSAFVRQCDRLAEKDLDMKTLLSKYDMKSLLGDNTVAKSRCAGVSVVQMTMPILDQISPMILLVKAGARDMTFLSKMTDIFLMHPLTQRDKGDNYVLVISTFKGFEDWLFHVASESKSLFEPDSKFYKLSAKSTIKQVDTILRS